MEKKKKRIRRMLVECCFTSTQTVGLLGTGAQDGHLDFHTAPDLWKMKKKKDFQLSEYGVSAAILCYWQSWVCDVMNKVGKYYRSVTVVSPLSLVSCVVSVDVKNRVSFLLQASLVLLFTGEEWTKMAALLGAQVWTLKYCCCNFFFLSIPQPFTSC